ncbi:hypothetical protein PGSY75_1147300 [Plasmodium gaboni]|uniref:Uncharacterized protein n=1 Tax=Plasmodium gaboni TaxID=647221 RepID=A0A151LJF5_9APIC|nr:hypothetical protein PGSY75_1147300 [Plasmodium gaboni]KYN99103.1 hypothetical protein PGSY75_1147300 [Plasmodium gaboni]
MVYEEHNTKGTGPTDKNYHNEENVLKQKTYTKVIKKKNDIDMINDNQNNVILNEKNEQNISCGLENGKHGNLLDKDKKIRMKEKDTLLFEGEGNHNTLSFNSNSTNETLDINKSNKDGAILYNIQDENINKEEKDNKMCDVNINPCDEKNKQKNLKNEKEKNKKSKNYYTINNGKDNDNNYNYYNNENNHSENNPNDEYKTELDIYQNEFKQSYEINNKGCKKVYKNKLTTEEKKKKMINTNIYEHNDFNDNVINDNIENSTYENKSDSTKMESYEKNNKTLNKEEDKNCFIKENEESVNDINKEKEINKTIENCNDIFNDPMINKGDDDYTLMNNVDNKKREYTKKYKNKKICPQDSDKYEPKINEDEEKNKKKCMKRKNFDVEEQGHVYKNNEKDIINSDNNKINNVVDDIISKTEKKGKTNEDDNINEENVAKSLETGVIKHTNKIKKKNINIIKNDDMISSNKDIIRNINTITTSTNNNTATKNNTLENTTAFHNNNYYKEDIKIGEDINKCFGELKNSQEKSQKDNTNNDSGGKKKYKRLLKNLEIDLSSKTIDHDISKRIRTWSGNLSLKEKINYFIKNNIATKTEYKYGKKPNTLSICNQFNLYNHLTMLNDFNRLHYYRAAMRWTGHKDISCESDSNNMLENGKNWTNTCSVNSIRSNSINMNNSNNGDNNTLSLCYTESINSMMNTANVNTMDNLNVYKLNNMKNGNNPYIFFENNKGCYVYNKNIIEIGTGPLSLLSINAILNGAKHVDALEVNRDASEMAKNLIEGYNLEDYIKIINCYSKVYEYKENDSQRKSKRKNLSYNFKDNSLDEHYCSNFNYDLIISEVIGDFASQEGVADIYLDLHKKIFSYRKYQEYLKHWNESNNSTVDLCASKMEVLKDKELNNKETDIKVGITKINEDDNIKYDDKNLSNINIEEEKNDDKNNDKNNDKENNKKLNVNIMNKENKLTYNQFSSNKELYNCEEFFNMNIKSIPYSVTTFYCPVKFPYTDNIIYKSDQYPERTIISPKNKLLQSVTLDWSNLTLNSDGKEDTTDFGVLEYLYLEQNIINQVIQKRNHIFCVTKSGPFCGFLITIDVEIRKGEHFGTKYGTCDSWYTNIVLLKNEIMLEENDLIINKTYTNLLNYNEHFVDKKAVLVSRPSYTFYGYILRPFNECTNLDTIPEDVNTMNSSSNSLSKELNNLCNEDNYIYLDDESILLLDQLNFYEKNLLYPSTCKEKEEGLYDDKDGVNNIYNTDEVKNMKEEFDRDTIKVEKKHIGKNSKQDERSQKIKKNKYFVVKKRYKKKKMELENMENKRLSNESKEVYEKDIEEITENYNLNTQLYFEKLKDKILIYKNIKYRILTFYDPVVIDYDEQATVIYKKDDIYNSKENNVNKFVNNVYQ